MNAPLVTTNLGKLPGSVTTAKPAMALGAIAFKGKQATDSVYINTTGLEGPAGSIGAQSASYAINGSQTDQGPTLAGFTSFQESMLYVAWKVAGADNVEVRQLLLTSDGVAVSGGQWVVLPATGGKASNPRVSTDASPAIAVGANNQLYMVWKKKGDTALEWSVYDGNGWSDPETIQDIKTNDAPALAGFDTSGPDNIWPLCLAYKGATGDGVFWAMFTPGATTIKQNEVPAVKTGVSPSVTAGRGAGNTDAAPYMLAWLPQGENSFCSAIVNGDTLGQIYTFPQANTNHSPAIYESSDDSTGFGIFPYDRLNAACVDKNTGDIWIGIWDVIHNPAPAPEKLGSSSQYYFTSNDGASPIKDLVVEILVTDDIVVSNESGGTMPPLPIGFQINGFSPKNKATTICWQQYGVRMSRGKNVLIAFAEGWPPGYHGGSEPKNVYNVHSVEPEILPDTLTIPAGWLIRIKFEQEPDGTIKGTKVSVTKNGEQVANMHVKLLDLYLTRKNKDQPEEQIQKQDLAQLTAFHVVLVGNWNSAHSTLKSGAGTITCMASTPIMANSNWKTNACATNGTLEQTNSIYGVVPAGPGKSIAQNFAVTKPELSVDSAVVVHDTGILKNVSDTSIQ